MKKIMFHRDLRSYIEQNKESIVPSFLNERRVCTPHLHFSI